MPSWPSATRSPKSSTVTPVPRYPIMVMNFEKRHEGTGYDLTRIPLLAPEKRQDLEAE